MQKKSWFSINWDLFIFKCRLLFWKTNIRQLHKIWNLWKSLKGMIQWLTQDTLVFEWISWINYSKTNQFLKAPFRQLKIKDAHTGMDFRSNIRFLNWNWFSIPNPTYNTPPPRRNGRKGSRSGSVYRILPVLVTPSAAARR